MLNSLLYLYSNFSSCVSFTAQNRYILQAQTSSSMLYSFLYFLKMHSLFRYNKLVDIAVLDTVEKKFRFLISYIVISQLYNTKLILSTRCVELGGVFSVATLFSAANWIEREIWDMYGILFFSHNNLKRILSDYGFKSFPLRRDFPLTGFLEVSYSHVLKKVTYRDVVLMQEYRNFYFEHYFTYWNKKLSY